MDIDFITRLNIEARVRGETPQPVDAVRMQADMVHGLGNVYRDHLDAKATLVEPGVYELNAQDAFIQPEYKRNSMTHPKKGDVVMDEQPVGVRSPEEIYTNQRIAHVAHLLKIDEVAKASDYMNETFANDAMPNTPEAHELRGMMRLGVWDTDEVKLLDPEGALQDLQYAVENSHSENPTSLKKNLAFALSLNGDMQASADLYEQIVDKDRSASEQERAECSFLKARCHFATGNTAEAQNAMKLALAFDWSTAIHASVDPICRKHSDQCIEVLDAEVAWDKSKIYKQLNRMDRFLTSQKEEVDLRSAERAKIFKTAKSIDIDGFLQNAAPKDGGEVDWNFKRRLNTGFYNQHIALDAQPDTRYHDSISIHQEKLLEIREDLDNSGLLDVSEVAIDLVHGIRKIEDLVGDNLMSEVVNYEGDVTFEGNLNDYHKMADLPDRTLTERISDRFKRMGSNGDKDAGKIYLRNEIVRVTDEVSSKFRAAFAEASRGARDALSASYAKSYKSYQKDMRSIHYARQDLYTLADPLVFSEISSDTKTFTMEVSATRPIEFSGVSDPFSAAKKEDAPKSKRELDRNMAMIFEEARARNPFKKVGAPDIEVNQEVASDGIHQPS